MYPSRFIRYQYLEPFQKFFLHPSMSLSSSIGFHLQPCSKGWDLHQAHHVCVIPWVSSELVQGLLSIENMIMHVMCLNSHWLQMSLYSLFLLSLRILMLQIFPCIPLCLHLLHVGSCRSIWKTLQNSLQVSKLHPRHHSSLSTGTLWSYSSSLSSWLLLHSWKDLHQWYH